MKIETVSEAFDNQFKNLEVMRKILWGDVVQLHAEAKKSNDICIHVHRSFIRSCYSFMDSVATRTESLSTLSMIAKGKKPKSNQITNMTNSIIRQLPEERNEGNKDRRTFCRRIKESLKVISELTGYAFDLSTQNVEWEEFNISTKVRDRITHPKVAEDLLVSKEEWMAVIRSTYWYQKMLDQVCLGQL